MENNMEGLTDSFLLSFPLSTKPTLDVATKPFSNRYCTPCINRKRKQTSCTTLTVDNSNRARLKAFALRCCDVRNSDIKKFVGFCSKASLLSSFAIFQARNEPTWSSPLPLVVRA